ncbi:MAG: hypothetical protein ACP5NS_00765 [Candidatus Pacearchaeota archaeon]
MTSALEYLARLHLTVTNDYRTPNGQYSESCGLIATDIAKRLLAENKTPYIVIVRGKLVDSANRKPIVPKPFGGRISWGAHQVCCEKGLAYDPMVGSKPVATRDYCEIAFKGEVEMDVLITEDTIREFVGR